jgi:two-component system, sensor histidine kinase FlrB
MALPANPRTPSDVLPPSGSVAVGRAVETPDADAQRVRLEQAYDFFGRVSDQLSQSQSLLQQQVDSLKSQLADVSAQRSHELAEKARLAGRLQNLLDLLPGGVIVLDGRGVVREANPAARELLGEPLEGMLWIDLIRERFAPRDDDYHEVSLRSGRRVSMATRSLMGEPGQLILLTDLTETRQLQSELARHERLSALGRTMASLAHQIRTPLATAMLYAGHLTDPALGEDNRQRFSERLKGRLQSIEQQVRDMLVFAKGDLPLTDRLSAFDLFESLRRDAEPMLEQSGATCHWDYRIEGNPSLLCNRDTLIGACCNLIDNAVQAGAPGARLKVLFRLHDGLLKLVVIDRGPGIAPALLARLGEPFHTTKPQGTGLGIAVARSVARAHQGSFAIRSKFGLGTCATISLPVSDSREVRQ